MSKRKRSGAGFLGIGVLLGIAGTLLAREAYKSHLDGGIIEKFSDIKQDVRQNVKPVVDKTKEAFGKIQDRVEDLKNSVSIGITRDSDEPEITEDDLDK